MPDLSPGFHGLTAVRPNARCSTFGGAVPASHATSRGDAVHHCEMQRLQLLATSLHLKPTIRFLRHFQ